MIPAGHRAELRIGGQILQIGLDHRRAGREHLDQTVFPLNEQVHDLVHRGWSRRRSRLRQRNGLGRCRLRGCGLRWLVRCRGSLLRRLRSLRRIGRRRLCGRL